MYRDRIIEQKNMLKISIRTISERSALNLPEETISRFLSKAKEHDCRVSTMLDIARAVELEPHELFMDAKTAAEFKQFLATREAASGTAEQIKALLDQTITQQQEIAALTAEIELLRLKLDHKDEIIKLHNRYNDYIDALKK